MNGLLVTFYLALGYLSLAGDDCQYGSDRLVELTAVQIPLLSYSVYFGY